VVQAPFNAFQLVLLLIDSYTGTPVPICPQLVIGYFILLRKPVAAPTGASIAERPRGIAIYTRHLHNLKLLNNIRFMVDIPISYCGIFFSIFLKKNVT
jgi:hypothetical protein